MAQPDHDETVDRLLRTATELTEESTGHTEGELESIAAEARDFLENSEPRMLLEAVGIDAPDAETPGDFIPALAEADRKPLVRLRRLQLLATVDRNDGEAQEPIEKFRALGDSLKRGDGGRDDSEEGQTDTNGTRTAESQRSDGGSAGADGEAADDYGDLAEQIHGALSDAVDELQETAHDGSDDEGGEAADEGDTSDSQSGSSKHSTMPSSERPDMDIPSRYSTL